MSNLNFSSRTIFNVSNNGRDVSRLSTQLNQFITTQAGVDAAQNTRIDDIKVHDSTNNHDLHLKVTGLTSGDVDFTFPYDMGTNGQYLSTNGAASFWANVPSGINADAHNNLVSSDAGPTLTVPDAEHNILLGDQAGHSITDAVHDVCIGAYAGQAITTSDNVLIGSWAASQNVTGGAETAVGYQAMASCSNDIGVCDTALGYQALYSLGIGIANATGLGASTVVTGSNGTAVGFEASAAANEVALGNGSVSVVRSGGDKTASLGDGSHRFTTSHEQTASLYGDNAANKVTLTVPDLSGSDYTFTLPADPGSTGQYLKNSDGNSTAVWADLPSFTLDSDSNGNTVAGSNNHTGYTYNTVMGEDAFNAADTSSSGATMDVAIGKAALGSCTTGYDNVGVGKGAGLFIVDEHDNTCVGYTADLASYNAGYNNSTALGAGAKISASNQVVLGDASVTQVAVMSNGACDIGSSSKKLQHVNAKDYKIYGGNSTNCVTLIAPTLGSSYTLTLPTTAGTNNYVLQTDGSGNCSWVAQTGGGGAVSSDSHNSTWLGSGQAGSSGGNHGAQITAVGYDALSYVTSSATYNTGVGVGAFPSLTNSNYMTALGYLSGANVQTNGSNCLFLGNSSGFDSLNANYTNSSCVGYGSVIDGSNRIVLGDSNVANVNPGADGTANLGASGKQWISLFANNAKLSNGTGHLVTIQPDASIGANYTLTLPATAGSSGQYLKNTGSGTLDWDTPSGGGGTKLRLYIWSTDTGQSVSGGNNIGWKTSAWHTSGDTGSFTFSDSGGGLVSGYNNDILSFGTAGTYRLTYTALFKQAGGDPFLANMSNQFDYSYAGAKWGVDENHFGGYGSVVTFNYVGDFTTSDLICWQISDGYGSISHQSLEIQQL